VIAFRPVSSTYSGPLGDASSCFGEPRTETGHYGPLLSVMSGMTVELWVTTAYLLLTIIGDLRASKLGVTIGPVPIFLTDITLFLLFLVSFVRWPSRLLYWISEGIGAGLAGRAVWLLVILAVLFFSTSVADYLLYSAHDLAIFCYSLFFPLVYFAIRDRRDALRLLRCVLFAGSVSAALLVLQETVGLDLGLFQPQTRFALGRTFVALRNGDSSFTTIALVGLLTFALFERKLRCLHIACAILCLLGVIASSGRASVVAIAAASAVSFCWASSRNRLRILLTSAVLALPVICAPILPESSATRQLDDLRISVISAAGGTSVDANVVFRTRRWHYALVQWAEHPFFGIGFGPQIIPSGLLDNEERKLGGFNVGMPHNSLLFVAARMGLVGLILIISSWACTTCTLLLSFRRTSQAELIVVANMLVAMLSLGLFGLMIERPGSNACFWIILAIGSRLLDQ
jgi:O-antigen ligase